MGSRERSPDDSAIESSSNVDALAETFQPSAHELAAIAASDIDGAKSASTAIDMAATVADTSPQPDDIAHERYARGATVGRYVILDALGFGSMGSVYSAYDTKLDRKVALKFLRASEVSPDADAHQRLEREAHVLAKLSHPNVVQVHDVELHGDALFIAMEFVDGHSLADWCTQSPRPPWRRVWSAYLDAARGLAAAHDKNIIHRDFKPANVLRGDDGRVRVVDFGLAAAIRSDRLSFEEPPPTTSDDLIDTLSSDINLDERLTAPGTFLGTPLYMAPEQYIQADVGPAADQYALCVSLYEGLYGRVPFDGTRSPGDVVGLHTAKQRGDLESAPKDTDIPEWLYTVITRGLEPDPDDRYPTMHALINALDHTVADTRRRRRRYAVLLTVIAVAAAGLFALMRTRDSAPPACSEVERELDGVWDERVEQAVQRAFQDTALGFADTAFDRVSTRISAYADAWVAMREEACRATQIHGTQTEQVMALRMACLNRRRDHLRALSGLLSQAPDQQIVENTQAMLGALPSLAHCADIAALTAAVPLPEDPVQRARIEALNTRVDRLELLHEAGKPAAGRALADALLTETDGLGHAPVEARAKYWMAMFRADDGATQEAEALLRDAITTAARARDDVLVARAWAELQYNVGVLQDRHDDAMALRYPIEVALARADDPETYSETMNNLALVLERMGEFEQAHQLLERVRIDDERRLGQEHPNYADTLSNLGLILQRLGRYDEAETMFERVLVLDRMRFGADHPKAALSYGHLASIANHRDQYDRSSQLLEQSTMIIERAYGDRHPKVARSLTYQAGIHRRSGQLRKAEALLRRALNIYEHAPGDHELSLTLALQSLGNTLVTLGQHEDGRVLLERSLALREQRLGNKHVDLIPPLLNLGNALRGFREYAAARRIHERALTIADEKLGEQHPTTGMALHQLSVTLLDSGDFDQAHVILTRALDTLTRAEGTSNRSLYRVHRAWSRLEQSRGQIANAIAHLQRALALEGLDDDERATLRHALAQLQTPGPAD